MFNSNLPGSFHSDVLTASPASDEQKLLLIGEIKSRAKGSITQRNFPEAVQLYTKAIDVCPESECNNRAILFANRSMCYASMNNFGAAADDATAAISNDASYIKGYFRRTVALFGKGDYRGARDAVLLGLELKPDDNELKSQLVKIDRQLSSQSSILEDAHVVSETVVTKSVNAKVASNVPSESARVISEEEGVDSSNLRGYKKRDDGRITTFFNNDLDEQAKALIGDIAPKKIEGASESAASTIGSSWNAAGTFESRDLTTWAHDRLKSMLVGLCIAGDSNLSLEIVDVVAVDGDAQFICARGKSKHVCDLSTEVAFRLVEVVGSTKSVVCESKLKVADITADGDHEIEWGRVADARSAPLQRQAAVVLKNTINAFVEELRSK